MSPQQITHIREIADQYDVFIVDQWGVLHDGVSLYSGIRNTLEHLVEARKEIVIVTNSSKTVLANQERLRTRFGLPKTLYRSLVSSADLLRDYITARARVDEYRVFCIADSGDDVILDGTGCIRVRSPAEADGVVLLSVAPGEGLPQHRAWVELSLAAGLPMMLPSADVLSVATSGVVPGLAEIVLAYKQRGGACFNFGKPDNAIYDAALIDIEISPDRVLAVGDQLESDVAGARRRGFSSLFVLTGAGSSRIGTTDPEVACRLLGSHDTPDDLRPSYVAASMLF